MARIPVGLQLYTLRDETAKDFAGTVRKVAEMGYEGIELAGDGGLSAADFKKLLIECNLIPAAAHVGLEAMEEDVAKVIDWHLEIGCGRLVVPALSPQRHADKAAWLATAEAMNKVGAKLKQHGMQLGYHNHAFEFVKFDGEYAYDLFFAAMDPELVKIEMDTYWVAYAGEEPEKYLRKYASRATLLHIKDMAPGPDRTFAEVGNGILDLDAIFTAASDSACAWYIVEQDVCQRPSLESVKISIENLKARGIAKA